MLHFCCFNFYYTKKKHKSNTKNDENDGTTKSTLAHRIKHFIGKCNSIFVNKNFPRIWGLMLGEV